MYQPIIRYDRIQQTNIDHLQHVLVLDRVRQNLKTNFWLSLFFESFVQRDQAFVITGGLTHIHGFTGEIIHCGDHWRLRSSDHNLVDRLRRSCSSNPFGYNEIHKLEPLWRYSETRGGDVAVPCG